MYWLRTLDLQSVSTWLVLAALWWAGGWSLCTHAFRLRPAERLLAGLGLGLSLFVSVSNLMANALPLTGALWAGSGLVLGLGLVAAWRSSHRPYFESADLRAWPSLLALGGLTLLFAMINRGLAIFDDYHNLPLVSVMAAGDVPPHYFLNTSTRLAYHYGLHLFAASLVRLGGLTPWSGYDLSKAFSLSLSVVLAWMWFRRATRSRLAGYIGALAILLGGGTRWLLLLLPADWIEKISAGVHLLGSAAQTGPDLSTNLTRPWAVEGGGPLPFPFAFANGVFPPQVMALGGGAALPAATLLLLCLLGKRAHGLLASVALALLLGSLALTAEHIYLLVWGGMALAWMLGVWQGRTPRHAPTWAAGFILSALLALGGGGLLTEMLRRGWMQLRGEPAIAGAGFTGFALRWPPAFVSAHLGVLSFDQAGQLLLALLEIGPALALGVWVTARIWGRLRRKDWVTAGLGFGALAGFLIPLAVQYVDRDRDIVRLSSSALLIWLILGGPVAWCVFRHARPGGRIGLASAYALIIFGGAVLLSVQLIAIPRPLFSYFIEAQDAALSRSYWDHLQPEGQVLDSVPYRAITLFGRGGGQAYHDLYQPMPAWQDLIANPDPARIARAGYTYIYLDQKWWRKMTPQQRQSFQAPCVIPVAERQDSQGFRRLLDVHACKDH